MKLMHRRPHSLMPCLCALSAVLRPLLVLALLAGFGGTASAGYIWPLSNSTTPDETNTSFGPRINYDKWDFHDGVDLPAPCTTTSVHAVATGTVISAGDANPPSWNARHVVVRVNDPTDGYVYVYYLHLDSIDPSVQVNQTVAEGQVIGKVGKDSASYCHLHLEFRKGNTQQASSVHPLRYLPYTDTANFTAPTAQTARFNRKSNGLMAARLLLGASSKLEGDLRRVEVDLRRSDSSLIATRVVDFNDKTTVNEGNGDEYEYLGDIAVEGYQTSDMVEDNRTNLEYGVLVRNLPSDCASLVARIIDMGNHTATIAAIAVPNQTATAWSLDFEDGAMPPSGWATSVSSGTTTSVSNSTSAAHAGARGMLCIDSSSGTSTQRAAITRTLPAARFEWQAEGWFEPTALSLPADQTVYPLNFRNLVDDSTGVAARIRNQNGVVAGILARDKGGGYVGKDSTVAINTGVWHKWTLVLLRVYTRETTGVLYLDDVEVARRTWDSTDYEPRVLRTGIGQSSEGVTATMYADDLAVTE